MAAHNAGHQQRKQKLQADINYFCENIYYWKVFNL